MTAVDQRVHDVAHVPVVVLGTFTGSRGPSAGQRAIHTCVARAAYRDFLEQLDPHVGQGHPEAVVKPDAAVRDRPAQRWHPRDVCTPRNVRGRASQQPLCAPHSPPRNRPSAMVMMAGSRVCSMSFAWCRALAVRGQCSSKRRTRKRPTSEDKYQHHVDDSVGVDGAVEVVGVVAAKALADAMVHVQLGGEGYAQTRCMSANQTQRQASGAHGRRGPHHGGHAVEAEPVKAVLFVVPPQVGQQEAQDLPVAVVEQAAELNWGTVGGKG